MYFGYSDTVTRYFVILQFSNFVLVTFHYEFYAIQKQPFSKHGGWNHSSISKPEFLDVSHTDYYNHISLINNIVSENKLEILAEFDNSLSSTEASQ